MGTQLFSFLFVTISSCTTSEVIATDSLKEGSATSKSVLHATPPPRRPRLRVSSHPAFEDGIIIYSDYEDVAVFRLGATIEPMAISDFTLQSSSTHPMMIDCVNIEYMDTTGTWISNSLAYDYMTGTATATGEDIFVPKRSTGRISLLIVSACANAVHFSHLWQQGDVLQIDWTDNGIQATGLYSGNSYDHRAVTDFASGAEMWWLYSEPIFSSSAVHGSSAVTTGSEKALEFSVENSGIEPNFYIDKLTFDIYSSDNASTGWNTCTNLADPSLFELYDLSDTTSALDDDANWEFYTEDGTDCSVAPSDIMTRAEIWSWSHLRATTTTNFELDFYPIGISKADHDDFQFDLTDAQWTLATYGLTYDGERVPSLPIEGTLVTY